MFNLTHKQKWLTCRFYEWHSHKGKWAINVSFYIKSVFKEMFCGVIRIVDISFDMLVIRNLMKSLNLVCCGNEELLPIKIVSDSLPNN